MLNPENNIELQEVNLHPDYQSQILRLDLVDELISGNKWFKLKYNLDEAKKQNKKVLLTFGGAFSNHILAVAAASKKKGFETIGIIRGEEHSPLNPTLKEAVALGMKLHYMDRSTYREKHTTEIINSLCEQFGDFYLVPEGGTNELAIRGAEEIANFIPDDIDFVCLSAGTGGTSAGIINANTSKTLVFSALKGDFMPQEIEKWLVDNPGEFEVVSNYHFGGYAKFNAELIDFIRNFKQQYDVPLDPIYTGKAMYGMIDLMNKNFFPKESKIVFVHTGGLQGIKGFNERFEKYQL